MPELDLIEQLRSHAFALGADMFGAADISPAEQLVREQGGEMIAQFPRALSIGVVMPFAIVDQVPRHQDKTVALAYRSHAYSILNDRLDQIASRIAGQVQQAGYASFPVRASLRVDDEKLYGHFSHKLAAHQAGLGWIGKSCLLVTPQVGPRVRWATVLTDAPLPTGMPVEPRCGSCTDCVDHCPVGAFTGRSFDPSEPREARFDVHKCRDYLDRNNKISGLDVSICGMCVYVCPFGKNGDPAKLF
ncbi:MAG: epoxyqueuosine reductase [Anaerolineales bacterium]|nr:epoxyqueuosine reductase [Anaerolineales bacterium]